MEKARQVKILSIVALVIAIAGMTLGFAAFSTTLSISSSASVTPNSEDFKINVYGFKDATAIEKMFSTGEILDSDLSDSFGYANGFYDATSDVASINNATHTISNIKGYFEKKGHVIYHFIIKNEGKYDAYLDISNLIFNSNENQYLANTLSPTCTPGDGATSSLVEDACNGVVGTVSFLDINTGTPKVISETYYKIPVGGSDLLGFAIEYRGPLADGPFDVEFEDFQLKFSTTK